MGKWMETAVNILMLFTTGTSVLFVIMYILAKICFICVEQKGGACEFVMVGLVVDENGRRR